MSLQKWTAFSKVLISLSRSWHKTDIIPTKPVKDLKKQF